MQGSTAPAERKAETDAIPRQCLLRRAGLTAGLLLSLGLAAALCWAMGWGAAARGLEASSSAGESLQHLTQEAARDDLDWPNASFIASLPIVHEEKRSTTVAPRVPCEYGPAEEGVGSCPQGSASVTEAECRKLPYYFGGVLHNPFTIESNNDPWGCFRFKGKFYYNSGYLGDGREGRTPFCKRCQVISDVEFAGQSHWSSSAYVIHRASPRFRIDRHAGGCRSGEQGMRPINDQVTCELAARALMLPEVNAALTCLQERPEGCYYLTNHEEGGRGMLFMNVNPLSKGNGAETSAFKRRVIRLPLCEVEEEAPTTPAPAADDSELAPGVCRAESKGVRKIIEGTCRDVAREAIADAAGCEAAARELALADTNVKVTTNPTRPMGCYYYRNPEDLTSTLWLNTSPESKSVKAEPTRHLLCAALEEEGDEKEDVPASAEKS